MNTGQIILTVGAMMLFSFIVISFGDLQSNFTTISLMNESIVTGSGICQSIVDEINAKSFDETTVGGAITVKEGLTVSASLGPDGGETNYLLYDDVDDFDNHARTVSSERLGDFVATVTVSYVNFDTPDTESMTRSFYKKVSVEVTTDLLDGTITQTSVVSY